MTDEHSITLDNQLWFLQDFEQIVDNCRGFLYQMLG